MRRGGTRAYSPGTAKAKKSLQLKLRVREKLLSKSVHVDNTSRHVFSYWLVNTLIGVFKSTEVVLTFSWISID